MRDEFVDSFEAAVDEDPSLMLITGDLGFGVLDDFQQRRPENFLNVGVAEQNMVLVAAGCALMGRRVFTYSIANFPTLRCLEMLRNDVAYHGLPVVTVSIGGGYSYGALGMSHHATEDIAIMRALPTMTVVVPGDLAEVRDATRQLCHLDGPAYLRIDKSWAANDQTVDADGDIRLGRIRQCRSGTDLSVFVSGGILGDVLKAVDSLQAEGHSIAVGSVHTVKPIDQEAILEAARHTGGIVTVEEHVLNAGLGSAVSEVLADHQAWPKRFLRLGLDSDAWAGVGSQSHLRSAAGLDASSIRGRLLHLLNGEGQRHG